MSHSHPNFPIVRLTRNLRKNLLRGDPWLYREALAIPANLNNSMTCKVVDSKSQFVGWGMYCPESPLAVRLLSLQREPPTNEEWGLRLSRAYRLRASLAPSSTDSYRLVNGEGDFLPGLVCDVYADTAVLQFDGKGPSEFWDASWLADWIIKYTGCRTVYCKPRHDSEDSPRTWGDPLAAPLVVARENGCQFYVDLVGGQKTGFFLDQRENRQYVRQLTKGKSVLNLFSYSGGFSVYAGMGGASSVTSVDVAEGALALAQKNWQLNDLPENQHTTNKMDVFEGIKGVNGKFDIVICDPPSLAKAEKHKAQAVQKYIELFADSAKKVQPYGHLLLSSCSSHIALSDFAEIVGEALSRSRKRGQILHWGGQGPDHPYPHACPHLRYLKFVDLIVH